MIEHSVGQWIQVRGKLEFAGTGTLSGMVCLCPIWGETNPLVRNGCSSIYFWFEPKWLGAIGALKPGDAVQLRGRIACLAAFWIDICNCELLPDSPAAVHSDACEPEAVLLRVAYDREHRADIRE